MTKILVTGATGNIGRKTLQYLLNRKPASELIGLARHPEKAADLAADGIEIRQGDYNDLDSLVRAFSGVEKVMLVSATAFSDRNTQHANVVKAARLAGVRHIVYMPIIRKDGSQFVLPHVTAEDIFAQEAIKASGLDYTFVGHPPFLESIGLYIGGKVFETGVHSTSGEGKARFAGHDDLAEAHAVVLSEPGHENKTYLLHGGPAVSFADIAQILSEMTDKPVPYFAVADQDFVDNKTAAGLSEPAAHFVLAWVHGINAGAWDGASDHLENLLGRKPTTVAEFMRASFLTGQA